MQAGRSEGEWQIQAVNARHSWTGCKFSAGMQWSAVASHWRVLLMLTSCEYVWLMRQAFKATLVLRHAMCHHDEIALLHMLYSSGLG